MTEDDLEQIETTVALLAEKPGPYMVLQDRIQAYQLMVRAHVPELVAEVRRLRGLVDPVKLWRAAP